MNEVDYQAQMINLMIELIEATHKQTAAINDLQFRTGNKPVHYDIVIQDCTPDTFRVIFNLRWVKDNPDLATKNKELKNHIQKTITAGLSENKHYTIDKIEKTNKAGTSKWQEWQFLFKSCYARLIGLRIEGLIGTDNITVKGLMDDLVPLTQSVTQLDLETKPTATEQNQQMKYLHTIGNEWAKLVFPNASWDETRRAFAKEILGKEVASFNEYTPAQLDRLIHVLLQQIAGACGTMIHGNVWLAKEADAVLWASDKRTDIMNDLTVKELQKLITQLKNRMSRQL